MKISNSIVCTGTTVAHISLFLIAYEGKRSHFTILLAWRLLFNQALDGAILSKQLHELFISPFWAEVLHIDVVIYLQCLIWILWNVPLYLHVIKGTSLDSFLSRLRVLEAHIAVTIGGG